MASHLESPTIQLLFSIPSKIITKHLPILQSSNRCKDAFSERPFIAYEKRPRNLPDLLVMAKLNQTKTPTSTTPSIKNATPSDAKPAPSLKTVYHHVHSKTLAKLASSSRRSMIQCRKCKSTPNTPAEYIGHPKRALGDRFGEHRRAIQNKTD